MEPFLDIESAINYVASAGPPPQIQMVQASIANNLEEEEADMQTITANNDNNKNNGFSSTPTGSKIAMNLKRFENTSQEVTYSSELYHRPVLGV